MARYVSPAQPDQPAQSAGGRGKWWTNRSSDIFFPPAHTQLSDFPAEAPPLNTADASQVYLRYGFTRQTAGEWIGWGYRKIAAKHGWGPDVKAQVATVLANDLNRVVFGLRYVYTAPVSGYQPGIECTRVVIVEYARNQWEVEGDVSGGFPAPSILTTFAYV